MNSLVGFEGGYIPEPNSGCWLWEHSITEGGYGKFYVPSLRRNVWAHRFSYEAFVGPIPEGLQIDHLCRVRCCVNPLHLEPVTRSVNLRRANAGMNLALRQLAKTRCPNGHLYSPENTYSRPNGTGSSRECRICKKAANVLYLRTWRQKKKGNLT